MKKAILGFITAVSVFVATVVVGAWFIAQLTASQSVSITVNAPENLTVSSSAITGSLTPIHGNAVTFLNKDGNATTDYYHETLTCTFEGSKAIYFDGIECDEDLSDALRVVIDKKIYAPSDYTKGIKVNDMPVICSASGKLGDYTNTASLDVTIFLEGEDEACINDNIVDELDIILNFHAE